MKRVAAALLFLGTALMGGGLLFDLPQWPRYTKGPPPDLWLARGLTLQEWLLFGGGAVLAAGFLSFLILELAERLREAASTRGRRSATDHETPPAVNP